MPNRDALWVLPNGTTTVVTVDEQGNPVDPIPGTEPAPEAPAAEPEIPAVEPVEPTPEPEPAPQVTRRRRRR